MARRQIRNRVAYAKMTQQANTTDPVSNAPVSKPRPVLEGKYAQKLDEIDRKHKQAGRGSQ